MNHFTQHIPNFCSGFEPIEFDFETVDELLAHKVCQNFAKTEGTEFKLNDSKSDYSSRYAIMAVRDDGHWWWVIGFVSEPVDLPLWTPKYRPPKCIKCQDRGTYLQPVTRWVQDPMQYLVDRKLPLIKETKNIQMQCPCQKAVVKSQK